MDAISLYQRLEFFPDPRGELRVEDVARRAFSSAPGPALSLGVWPGQSRPLVWMRFEVRVPRQGLREEWALVIGRPHDRGTVFIEQADGRFRPAPIRLDGSGASFRLPLPLRSGTTRVLLRVQRPTQTPSLLHLATAQGQARLELRVLTEQGLYVGVMATMLFVNLLLVLLMRDRVYLWYVAFLASSSLAFSFLTGTVSRFILPTVPAGDLFRPQVASLVLLVLTGIQFSRRFLDTPRMAPRADRVMRAYLVLAAAVFVAAWIVPDVLALRAVALLGVLVPFVALAGGISSWRAGSRWARFYLVGWSLFTLGGFLFAAPGAGAHFDTLSFFQLCSAGEAALFSVALVDRMRVLRTERTQAELKVARAEKLAALGQLVAGVAHEVNNPNNFLTFNLPILQEYFDALRPHAEAARDKDPDLRLFGLGVDEFFADATTLIGNMKHGTERIAGIVAQLRSYVRQNDEAQWEVADVNRVAENAATMVRTQLQRAVERFDVSLADVLPFVRMSPGRIEQVIINLLINAGQAAAATPHGRVELQTRREDGHVVIAVQDNGPGVPEAIRERIFEPFFTTKSGEQGTGMGLAICQRIVDEHGGTIELTSGTGQGACFVVRLPHIGESP